MDKQFKIYSINFGAFYTDEEKEINKQKIDICNKMHDIEAYYKFIEKNRVNEDELTLEDYLTRRTVKGDLNIFYERSKEENKKWEKELRELTESERKLRKKHKIISENKNAKKLARSNEEYQKLKSDRKIINSKLKDKLKEFKGTRKLREDSLLDENLISLFDSSFSRTIGVEYDKTTLDIICITISHYDVMEQLINNGFTFETDGQTFKYRVLTSSAGQIRKKKIVFIKENVWDKFSESIMCGLSWDKINEQGGMNINKFLAYLALQNSATDKLEGFNIDECIVIDDFRTVLKDREVEYIEKINKEVLNKDTGELNDKLVIKNPVIVNKDIEIEHSDGCGLQIVKKKSFQIRLPFVKGLMTYGNWKKFCNDNENSNPVIKDLWGKEWNVLEDNIKYIFTKSQFKMWKYYNNEVDENGKVIKTGWDVYKDYFKNLNCHASYCNEEENKKDFRHGQFNYQYWQSLTDITDEEIEHFTNPIINKINDCHYNVKSMLDVFGVNDRNKNMNIEQKILKKYPVLLKDYHFQDSLSSKLSKIKKEAKCGKFKTKSINTFLLPDIYAWFEQLFLGIKIPKGLLKDGEVSCRYFENKKLLLDRSPHLYREHAVRNNITKITCEDSKMKYLLDEYFVTNGIYTSTHDLISKILQFDVDGDHSLVTCDEKLIEIVERNCEGILPLYYDMGKADAELITTQNIINSLKSAFKYGNIGMYSNKITNIWNSEDFDEKAMNLIKLLTAENNYSIDSAKTLEMVDLDDDEKTMYKDLLKQANGKMPYFFQFAKDKDKNSVKYRTNSTVNRLCKNIEDNVVDNYKYDFSKLGKFNARYLVSDKWNSINTKSDLSKSIIEKFKEVDNTKNKLFIKAKNNQQELDKVAPSVYSIAKEELNKFIKDLNITYKEVSNILIKYYFSDEKTSKKTLLINLFGEYILSNLEENLNDKDFGFCEVCGERFDKNNIKNTSQIYCKECQKNIEKEKKKLRNKRYYEKLRR
ncbi:hypothetical protein [Clostridium butyricum]|uniref:hypothetical protein n=1 Tax=Clostridium butyricum TaxID=1492 RepID=UPI00325B1958